MATVALVPAAEWQEVVERWNATAVAFPGASCIHEAFEAQVARTPDAVAVVGEDERGQAEALTYGALEARATALAAALRTRGVGPEARVAPCLERAVGFRPKTPIAEGIRLFVEW